MKMMTLVLSPIEWAWSSGNESGSFYLLLTGMVTETRSVSFLRDQKLISCVWQTVEKGEEQSPRKIKCALWRCGTRNSSAAAGWAKHSSVCVTHTAPGPHTLLPHLSVPSWKQNWAWGMHKGSAWSTESASHLPWDVNLWGWSLCSLQIQILTALGNTDLIWTSKVCWQGYC